MLTEYAARHPFLLALMGKRHSWLLRRFRDLRVDLDDVNQECWLEVVKVFPRYDSSKGMLSTWLTRVVLNRCLDLYGDAKRKMTRKAGPQTPPQPVDFDLIDTLSPVEQDFACLHYGDGVKLKDLAILRNVPLNRVRYVLRTGRLKLRKGQS